MTLEIVDEYGDTLIRKENEQCFPSIGDEIWVKEHWYKVTERTFFYRDDKTSVYVCTKLIEGA